MREPLATLFYNKVYSVPQQGHATERLRELFGRTLKYDYTRLPLDYGIDPGRIAAHPTRQQRPVVLFLHGTTWDNKHQLLQYWQQLAQLAAAAGYQVLVHLGN